MNDLQVRPASWADRVAIAALVEGMGGHDGVTIEPGWSIALGTAIQSPDSRVLLALRGAHVVGMAHIDARPSIGHGGREAWLGTIAIAENERGAGVGQVLLDAIERAAELLGCGALVLESSHQRSEAHAFYRSAGFVEQPPARRFRRMIADPSEDLIDRFLAVAARAATAVAGVLAAGGEGDIAVGADGLPTKEIDRAAEDAALALLAELDLPILSEEAGIVGHRGPSEHEPWIALDPLDGTRNFTRGHPPWATAIGLVCGRAPMAGYVADLSSGRRWWGAPDRGAWADGRAAAPRSGGLLVVPGLTTESTPPRLPDGYDRLRMAGSTTVELCRVADGAAGAFVDLHRGVVRVHDLAAPMAILSGAGCQVVTIDGAVPVLEPDPRHRYRIVAAAPRADLGALLALPLAVGSP